MVERLYLGKTAWHCGHHKLVFGSVEPTVWLTWKMGVAKCLAAQAKSWKQTLYPWWRFHDAQGLLPVWAVCCLTLPPGLILQVPAMSELVTRYLRISSHFLQVSNACFSWICGLCINPTGSNNSEFTLSWSTESSGLQLRVDLERAVTHMWIMFLPSGVGTLSFTISEQLPQAIGMICI